MMQKVKIVIFFIISLYHVCAIVAQESKFVEKFKHIDEAFNFLQSQDLLRQSFPEFLTDDLVQNGDEEDKGKANFEKGIEQSHLIISNILSEKFIQSLDSLCQSPACKLTSIQDPIFLYVLHTQNFLIEGLRHECCQQWSGVQDADGNSRLHHAVVHKNRALLSVLVDAKINLNIKNYDGATPLFYAVHEGLRSGMFDIVTMLVDAGADYTIPLHNGWSILHKIVFYENCKLALQFVELGMNINIQDSKGDAPMHGAAMWRSKKIMKFLIEKGADINIQNNEGATPLHVAVGFGHEKIVFMLLNAGADIDIKNDEGRKAEDVHVAESDQKAIAIKKIFTEYRQGIMPSDNQTACCLIS